MEELGELEEMYELDRLMPSFEGVGLPGVPWERLRDVLGVWDFFSTFSKTCMLQEVGLDTYFR